MMAYALESGGIPRLAAAEKIAREGMGQSVDILMEILAAGDCFVTSKIIDHALSLVNTGEGINRIKYYLFNGAPIQRNYAALFFKRRGSAALLALAVSNGCVDETQAFSK